MKKSNDSGNSAIPQNASEWPNFLRVSLRGTDRYCDYDPSYLRSGLSSGSPLRAIFLSYIWARCYQFTLSPIHTRSDSSGGEQIDDWPDNSWNKYPHTNGGIYASDYARPSKWLQYIGDSFCVGQSVEIPNNNTWSVASYTRTEKYFPNSTPSPSGCGFDPVDDEREDIVEGSTYASEQAINESIDGFEEECRNAFEISNWTRPIFNSGDPLSPDSVMSVFARAASLKCCLIQINDSGSFDFPHLNSWWSYDYYKRVSTQGEGEPEIRLTKEWRAVTSGSSTGYDYEGESAPDDPITYEHVEDSCEDIGIDNLLPKLAPYEAYDYFDIVAVFTISTTKTNQSITNPTLITSTCSSQNELGQTTYEAVSSRWKRDEGVHSTYGVAVIKSSKIRIEKQKGSITYTRSGESIAGFTSGEIASMFISALQQTVGTLTQLGTSTADSDYAYEKYGNRLDWKIEESQNVGVYRSEVSANVRSISLYVYPGYLTL